MRRDPVDGLPVVGSTSSSELGVRPGVDIAIDEAGNVVLDESGMSVAPDWRDLGITRIPKTLRHIVPGANASPNMSCYATGVGPFQNGALARGLELIPDRDLNPVTHGVIAPLEAVTFSQFQADLENTRAAWQIDET